MDPNLFGSQWESSKENIQPIRHGRKASVLATALSEDCQSELNLERQKFEEQLRSYCGDDPLDIWYNYAKWVEQNYPKGGNDGSMIKLLESCFKTLQSSAHHDAKYRNDERLLELWIKYANLCSSHTLEVFQALKDKGYFLDLANLYDNFAWELEKVGAIKKANNVYIEGIDKKAKPTNFLEMSYNKFLWRTSKDMKENIHTTSEEKVENQRKIMSALTTVGNKAQAPSERVTTVVGSAGPYCGPKQKVNAASHHFKIHQDENDVDCIKTLTETPTSFIPHGSATKENNKCASQWNKNKMKQRYVPNVPVQDVGLYSKPTFNVYSDEADSSNTASKSASKTTDISNVLTVRKPIEDVWNVPLYLEEPFNPKAQPQYSKHLVYCGTEEFSFEEIRALHRQRKEEAEKNALMQKEKEQKEKEKQLFLQNEIQTLKKIITQQKQRISTLEERKEDIDSNDALKPTFDADSTEALLILRPPEEVKSSSSSLSDIKSGLDTAPHSPHSNSSLSRNDASMTVNTKFANNYMYELFSAPLLKTPTNKENTNTSSFHQPISNLSNASFKMYQDKNEALVPHANKPAFAIYKDESISLPDKKLRPLITNHHKKIQDFSTDSKPPLTIFYDEHRSAFVFPVTEPEFTNKSITKSDTEHLLSYSESEIQYIKPQTPFVIYQDENKASELCTTKPAILKSNDKNNRPPLMEKTERNESPHEQVDNNDQENIPPKGYQSEEMKFNRVCSGILQPSQDIPYIPLEMQMHSEYEDVPFEGICDMKKLVDEDVRNSICPPEDFTMKIPLSKDDFDKMALLASTPMFMSSGRVPQVTCDDDYTMAAYMHNKNTKREEICPVYDKDCPKDVSVPKTTLTSDNSYDAPANEKSEELMPPPTISLAAENHSSCLLTPIIQSKKTAVNVTSKSSNTHLSPIMEASRELKSSSSSSDNCTTLGTHSNTYGLSRISHGLHQTIDNKNINFSHTTTWASDHVNELHTSHLGENTKSGYFADKSRGESISEASWEKMVQKKDDLEPKLNGDIQFPDAIDPFCSVLQDKLLTTLKNPVEKRGGFVRLSSKWPHFKKNNLLSLDKEKYRIKRLCGSGAYAQVFHASTIDPMNVTIIPSSYEGDSDDEFEDEESQVVMKVQKPACYWEFYICHELRERLKRKNCLNLPESLDSFQRINRGYFFPQGSICVSHYYKFGTILDLVNRYKKIGKSVPENIIFLLMAKIINCISAMHSCNMIHGDMKPDNVLVSNIFGKTECNSVSFDVFCRSSNLIHLIDFGRSIDMDLLPQGTTFTKKVTTDGFMCCEMRDNRPWTYQTDYYGLAAIAHCMIWGSYMEVKKDEDTWMLSGVRFYRYHNTSFWKRFFNRMLNVDSCSSLLDLRETAAEIEEIMNIHRRELKRDIDGLCTRFNQK